MAVADLESEYGQRMQALGRAVIADGRLKQLQVRLQWSANTIGELLHISPTTYRGWLSRPDTNVWALPAFKVGEFYRDVVDMLAVLRSEGINIDDYWPVQKLAMELGWPHEVLIRQIRAGKLLADDFEILGLWVPVDEVNRLRRERHHRVAA